MLKVTVDSTHVETRKGVSKRNGKPYEMHTQAAWVFLVDGAGNADRFPTKARFSLDNPQDAYPVGNYTIAPGSLRVNQWGDLELSFPKLTPVAAAARAQAVPA